MPYPKKLLNDYETVALDLHPHWWYFVEAAVALAGAIVFGIIVLAATALVGQVGRRRRSSCGAVWLLVRYVKWLTTNFVITSDRVIFRHGVSPRAASRSRSSASTACTSTRASSSACSAPATC